MPTRRLIDANALNKELQKRVGSPTDDKLYEVNLAIIEAPTIPAITVEWLKEKAKDNYDYSGTLIRGLLSEWQKEQEVQDG